MPINTITCLYASSDMNGTDGQRPQQAIRKTTPPQIPGGGQTMLAGHCRSNAFTSRDRADAIVFVIVDKESGKPLFVKESDTVTIWHVWMRRQALIAHLAQKAPDDAYAIAELTAPLFREFKAWHKQLGMKLLLNIVEW